MKKKVAILVTALMVVLVVCLTGCNTNFKFKDLSLTNENITHISVTFQGDRKETGRAEKIENIINELNGLDVAKCKEKIADNVFKDSVIGQISMNVLDKEGSFNMIFVETMVNGARTCLLKCEATDGLKIKNMPKDIYQMADTSKTNAMLSKIFYNYC